MSQDPGVAPAAGRATRIRRPDLWARHLAAGALGRAGAPSYQADDQ